MTMRDINNKISKLLCRVNVLKRKLNQTNGEAISFAAGEMTEAEYAPIRAQRQAWCDEINALEKEIEAERVKG